MLSLTIWAVLVCGQVAAPAPANEQAAAEIRQLVRDLNSDELTKRDTAEQALVKRGPSVLELLPAESKRMPAEQAQRLARVRQVLLKAQAEASAQASVVTLTTDGPAGKVLAEIAKQTGNKIVNRSNTEPEGAKTEVSVHFAGTPFWQALDDVLDQAKLTVDAFSGDGGLAVYDAPPGKLPRAAHAVYHGPFRLEPTRFEALAVLTNPQQRALKLFFEVSWEPRLMPIAITQPLKQVTAVSDGGMNLSAEVAGGGFEATVTEGTPAVEIEVPLQSPPRTAKKLASVKGRLDVLMSTQKDSFHFDSLPLARNDRAAKPVEQRKGGVTVVLDQVRKNSKDNDLWEVQMRVRFDDPAQALESHRTWILNNEAYLLDANHEKIAYDGCEQMRQAVNEVGVKYLFSLEKGPEKLSFVYETPLAILPIAVDYEFRDLELP